jgi:hypothetical protein
MKKLLVVCVMVGVAAGARAQDSAGALALAVAPATLAAAPAAFSAPGLSLAAPAPAEPPAGSTWRFGLRDEYSWQFSFGYAYVRLRSTPLSTGLNGVNTAFAKYFNNWLGAEGEVTAAFGPVVPGAGRAKYLFYGGGPRIAARNRWRIEPWIHGVAGMVRVQPELGAGSKSGFAIEGGGGVDWLLKRQVAFRVEGDWVRSRLYGANQNNFQVVSGIVFNF